MSRSMSEPAHAHPRDGVGFGVAEAVVLSRPADAMGGIFVVALLGLVVLLLIEVGLIILGLPGQILGG